jgi:hypothetical protein
VSLGQNRKKVLDSHGPPKTVIVQWLRETNGNWQQIVEGETYTIQDADCGRPLCAKVIVTTQRSLMGESFTTETLTQACLVAPTDPLLVRFASTMKHAGEAQFEGLLITGDSALLSIEEQEGNAQFSIKLERTVLHTSEIQDANVELCDNESNSVIVTGSRQDPGLKSSL